jgi:hypothetical protein
MMNKVFQGLALAALMLLLVVMVACGGSENTATPEQKEATAAPLRTKSATRAPGGAAQPTQDPLDDSTNNTNQDAATEVPGNAAQPTQDTLDDSPNPTKKGGSQPTPAPKTPGANSGSGGQQVEQIKQ